MIRSQPDAIVADFPGQRSSLGGLDRLICDRCKRLLRRLGWPGDVHRPTLRILGMTSCEAGEGVSTVASHVAAAAAGACSGRAILLVDANAKSPAIMDGNGLQSRPGLLDVLAGTKRLLEAIQESDIPNLFFLDAGSRACSASSSDAWRGLPGVLKELGNDFHLVVVDLPPARQAVEERICSGAFDGLVLVVGDDRQRDEPLRQVLRLLRDVGERPLGIVLNKTSA